jgi:CRP-like cAMP-binding protein
MSTNLKYDNFQKYLIEKANLSEAEITSLLPYFSLKHVKKGHVLLAEGGIAHHAYFVESGLLRLYSVDNQGKEHLLQFAPENWWLSDRNDLSSAEPSAYYIDAYENTTVVLLNQDFVQKAAAISSAFRVFHDQILQRHINQLYHRVNMLIGASAKDRYLHFLQRYPNITQRVPQWMIASYLGIAPESLSRVRKELVGENVRRDESHPYGVEMNVRDESRRY